MDVKLCFPAGGQVVAAVGFGFKQRALPSALVGGEGTAGMEGATGGRIDGAGDFAGKDGVAGFSMGVGLRNGVQ